MSTPPIFNTGDFNTQTFGGGSKGSAAGQVYVSDIIYAAYRIAGILQEAGRGYSGSELGDGLRWLNSMIDSWKAERLMVYAILRSVFDIQAGQQVYTIGDDENADTPADYVLQRPERIERAGFLWTNITPVVEVPFRIFEVQEWESLSPKELTSSVPWGLYYEPFVPFGNINVWPIPTSNWKLALYTWQYVQEFQSASDPVVVPPAYCEALEYQLALRLAQLYPRRAAMTPLAIQHAHNALAKVKSINAPTYLMECEKANSGIGQKGHYDIFSNQYR